MLLAQRLELPFMLKLIQVPIVKFGGGEGSRTPVRKPIHKSFSERRRLFTFPWADGSRQSSALSSFMMHGTGKAYRTHGRH